LKEESIRVDGSIEEVYRTLGIIDTAGYDEIMKQVELLKEQNAGDPKKLIAIDVAKSRAVDAILAKRLDGSMKANYEGQMAPEDRPVEKNGPIKRIWTRIKRYWKAFLDYFSTEDGEEP
jgi:hypothetical protein